KKWCEDNSEIPDDEDAVFVEKFEYATMPSQIFRVFLTSKRLIKSQKMQHFLSDATYKLRYENFPIITGSTTDRNKSFHPFGLAICRTENEDDFGFFFNSVKETHEKVFNKTISFSILIADNAGAITKGFAKAFDLKTRVNCWAHVNRNIDIRVKSISKLQAERIVYDISEIQKIFEPELFPIDDLVKAYKWNSYNKTIIHLKDDNYYYLTADDKIDINKEQCKQYNQSLIGKKWSSFDHLITSIFSIRKIKYNENSWTLKKKCNFDSVGMDIPIQANRKKGRSKDTAGPLEHQPKEKQATNSAPKGIDTDDEDSSSTKENPSKRLRIDSIKQVEEKFCEKYGAKMTKRRYWACSNKCGKK
ncbi:unnamed protein product, partial [Brachionus calyciflorus]